MYNSYFTVSNISSSTSTISDVSTSAQSYTAASSDNQSVLEVSKLGLEEGSSDQRFMRFMNPVFKYDFKVGNYLPDDAKKLNPHLFMTIKDITTGIRKSS